MTSDITNKSRTVPLNPAAFWQGCHLVGCYAGPETVANAIGCAMHYSRSGDVVIRVYDAAGNVVETHEHTGDFKQAS